MTETETAIGPEVGRLQTDTFCEGCGYNLHTQAVRRDERLGLLVSRCPECGRFAAAGHGANAARVWLQRFATAMLVVWVAFILGWLALLSFFQGLIPFGYAEDSVQFTVMAASSAHPSHVGQIYRNVPKHYGPGDDEWKLRHDREFVILILIASALAIGDGCMFAALFWHARGMWRAFAFLPPVLACGVASLIWMSDPMMEYVLLFGVERIAVFLGVEIVGVAIGLVIGRPVARGLLTLFVPPRARQHFSFMWKIDGKAMAPLS